MPNYYIKLTVEAPSREKFRGRDYFRMRATTSEGIGIANEVFLARNRLIDPDDPDSDPKVEFQSVCSVYDMSIYPANSPEEGQSPPFFRVDTLDILLPSVEVYDETVILLQQQVEQLLDQHEKLDVLEVQQETWLPSTPTSTSTTPAP